MSGSPSGSESLARTPGAATISGVSWFVAKESSCATGGWSTGFTVIVTVATSECARPSVAQ